MELMTDAQIDRLNQETLRHEPRKTDPQIKGEIERSIHRMELMTDAQIDRLNQETLRMVPGFDGNVGERRFGKHNNSYIRTVVDMDEDGNLVSIEATSFLAAEDIDENFAKKQLVGYEKTADGGYTGRRVVTEDGVEVEGVIVTPFGDVGFQVELYKDGKLAKTIVKANVIMGGEAEMRETRYAVFTAGGEGYAVFSADGTRLPAGEKLVVTLNKFMTTEGVQDLGRDVDFTLGNDKSWHSDEDITVKTADAEYTILGGANNLLGQRNKFEYVANGMTLWQGFKEDGAWIKNKGQKGKEASAHEAANGYGTRLTVRDTEDGKQEFKGSVRVEEGNDIFFGAGARFVVADQSSFTYKGKEYGAGKVLRVDDNGQIVEPSFDLLIDHKTGKCTFSDFKTPLRDAEGIILRDAAGNPMPTQLELNLEVNNEGDVTGHTIDGEINTSSRKMLDKFAESLHGAALSEVEQSGITQDGFRVATSNRYAEIDFNKERLCALTPKNIKFDDKGNVIVDISKAEGVWMSNMTSPSRVSDLVMSKLDVSVGEINTKEGKILSGLMKSIVSYYEIVGAAEGNDRLTKIIDDYGFSVRAFGGVDKLAAEGMGEYFKGNFAEAKAIGIESDFRINIVGNKIKVQILREQLNGNPNGLTPEDFTNFGIPVGMENTGLIDSVVDKLGLSQKDAADLKTVLGSMMNKAEVVLTLQEKLNIRALCDAVDTKTEAAHEQLKKLGFGGVDRNEVFSKAKANLALSDAGLSNVNAVYEVALLRATLEDKAETWDMLKTELSDAKAGFSKELISKLGPETAARLDKLHVGSNVSRLGFIPDTDALKESLFNISNELAFTSIALSKAINAGDLEAAEAQLTKANLTVQLFKSEYVLAEASFNMGVMLVEDAVNRASAWGLVGFDRDKFNAAVSGNLNSGVWIFISQTKAMLAEAKESFAKTELKDMKTFSYSLRPLSSRVSLLEISNKVTAIKESLTQMITGVSSEKENNKFVAQFARKIQEGWFRTKGTADEFISMSKEQKIEYLKNTFTDVDFNYRNEAQLANLADRLTYVADKDGIYQATVELLRETGNTIGKAMESVVREGMKSGTKAELGASFDLSKSGAARNIERAQLGSQICSLELAYKDAKNKVEAKLNRYKASKTEEQAKLAKEIESPSRVWHRAVMDVHKDWIQIFEKGIARTEPFDKLMSSAKAMVDKAKDIFNNLDTADTDSSRTQMFKEATSLMTKAKAKVAITQVRFERMHLADKAGDFKENKPDYIPKEAGMRQSYKDFDKAFANIRNDLYALDKALFIIHNKVLSKSEGVAASMLEMAQVRFADLREAGQFMSDTRQELDSRVGVVKEAYSKWFGRGPSAKEMKVIGHAEDMGVVFKHMAKGEHKQAYSHFGETVGKEVGHKAIYKYRADLGYRSITAGEVELKSLRRAKFVKTVVKEVIIIAAVTVTTWGLGTAAAVARGAMVAGRLAAMGKTAYSVTKFGRVGRIFYRLGHITTRASMAARGAKLGKTTMTFTKGLAVYKNSRAASAVYRVAYGLSKAKVAVGSAVKWINAAGRSISVAKAARNGQSIAAAINASRNISITQRVLYVGLKTIRGIGRGIRAVLPMPNLTLKGLSQFRKFGNVLKEGWRGAKTMASIGVFSTLVMEPVIGAFKGKSVVETLTGREGKSGEGGFFENAADFVFLTGARVTQAVIGGALTGFKIGPFFKFQPLSGSSALLRSSGGFVKAGIEWGRTAVIRARIGKKIARMSLRNPARAVLRKELEQKAALIPGSIMRKSAGLAKWSGKGMGMRTFNLVDTLQVYHAYTAAFHFVGDRLGHTLKDTFAALGYQEAVDYLNEGRLEKLTAVFEAASMMFVPIGAPAQKVQREGRAARIERWIGEGRMGTAALARIVEYKGTRVAKDGTVHRVPKGHRSMPKSTKAAAAEALAKRVTPQEAVEVARSRPQGTVRIDGVEVSRSSLRKAGRSAFMKRALSETGDAKLLEIAAAKDGAQTLLKGTAVEGLRVTDTMRQGARDVLQSKGKGREVALLDARDDLAKARASYNKLANSGSTPKSQAETQRAQRARTETRTEAHQAGRNLTRARFSFGRGYIGRVANAWRANSLAKARVREADYRFKMLETRIELQERRIDNLEGGYSEGRGLGRLLRSMAKMEAQNQKDVYTVAKAERSAKLQRMMDKYDALPGDPGIRAQLKEGVKDRLTERLDIEMAEVIHGRTSIDLIETAMSFRLSDGQRAAITRGNRALGSTAKKIRIIEMLGTGEGKGVVVTALLDKARARDKKEGKTTVVTTNTEANAYQTLGEIKAILGNKYKVILFAEGVKGKKAERIFREADIVVTTHSTYQSVIAEQASMKADGRESQIKLDIEKKVGTGIVDEFDAWLTMPATLMSKGGKTVGKNSAEYEYWERAYDAVEGLARRVVSSKYLRDESKQAQLKKAAEIKADQIKSDMDMESKGRKVEYTKDQIVEHLLNGVNALNEYTNGREYRLVRHGKSYRIEATSEGRGLTGLQLHSGQSQILAIKWARQGYNMKFIKPLERGYTGNAEKAINSFDNVIGLTGTLSKGTKAIATQRLGIDAKDINGEGTQLRGRNHVEDTPDAKFAHIYNSGKRTGTLNMILTADTFGARQFYKYLLKQGVKKSEIVFIGGASTFSTKRADAMLTSAKQGKVRWVIGDAYLIGRGTNISPKLGSHDVAKFYNTIKRGINLKLLDAENMTSTQAMQGMGRVAGNRFRHEFVTYGRNETQYHVAGAAGEEVVYRIDFNKGRLDRVKDTELAKRIIEKSKTHSERFIPEARITMEAVYDKQTLLKNSTINELAKGKAENIDAPMVEKALPSIQEVLEVRAIDKSGIAGMDAVTARAIDLDVPHTRSGFMQKHFASGNSEVFFYLDRYTFHDGTDAFDARGLAFAALYSDLASLGNEERRSLDNMGIDMPEPGAAGENIRTFEVAKILMGQNVEDVSQLVGFSTVARELTASYNINISLNDFAGLDVGTNDLAILGLIRDRAAEQGNKALARKAGRVVIAVQKAKVAMRTMQNAQVNDVKLGFREKVMLNRAVANGFTGKTENITLTRLIQTVSFGDTGILTPGALLAFMPGMSFVDAQKISALHRNLTEKDRGLADSITISEANNALSGRFSIDAKDVPLSGQLAGGIGVSGIVGVDGLSLSDESGRPIQASGREISMASALPVGTRFMGRMSDDNGKLVLISTSRLLDKAVTLEKAAQDMGMEEKADFLQQAIAAMPQAKAQAATVAQGSASTLGEIARSLGVPVETIIARISEMANAYHALNTVLPAFDRSNVRSISLNDQQIAMLPNIGMPADGAPLGLAMTSVERDIMLAGRIVGESGASIDPARLFAAGIISQEGYGAIEVLNNRGITPESYLGMMAAASSDGNVSSTASQLVSQAQGVLEVIRGTDLSLDELDNLGLISRPAMASIEQLSDSEFNDAVRQNRGKLERVSVGVQERLVNWGEWWENINPIVRVTTETTGKVAVPVGIYIGVSILSGGTVGVGGVLMAGAAPLLMKLVSLTTAFAKQQGKDTGEVGSQVVRGGLNIGSPISMALWKNENLWSWGRVSIGAMLIGVGATIALKVTKWAIVRVSSKVIGNTKARVAHSLLETRVAKLAGEIEERDTVKKPFTLADVGQMAQKANVDKTTVYQMLDTSITPDEIKQINDIADNALGLKGVDSLPVAMILNIARAQNEFASEVGPDIAYSKLTEISKKHKIPVVEKIEKKDIDKNAPQETIPSLAFMLLASQMGVNIEVEAEKFESLQAEFAEVSRLHQTLLRVDEGLDTKLSKFPVGTLLGVARNDDPRALLTATLDRVESQKTAELLESARNVVSQESVSMAGMNTLVLKAAALQGKDGTLDVSLIQDLDIEKLQSTISSAALLVEPNSPDAISAVENKTLSFLVQICHSEAAELYGKALSEEDKEKEEALKEALAALTLGRELVLKPTRDQIKSIKEERDKISKPIDETDPILAQIPEELRAQFLESMVKPNEEKQKELDTQIENATELLKKNEEALDSIMGDLEKEIEKLLHPEKMEDSVAVDESDAARPQEEELIGAGVDADSEEFSWDNSEFVAGAGVGVDGYYEDSEVVAEASGEVELLSSLTDEAIAVLEASLLTGESLDVILDHIDMLGGLEAFNALCGDEKLSEENARKITTASMKQSGDGISDKGNIATDKGTTRRFAFVSGFHEIDVTNSTSDSILIKNMGSDTHIFRIKNGRSIFFDGDDKAGFNLGDNENILWMMTGEVGDSLEITLITNKRKIRITRDRNKKEIKSIEIFKPQTPASVSRIDENKKARLKTAIKAVAKMTVKQRNDLAAKAKKPKALLQEEPIIRIEKRRGSSRLIGPIKGKRDGKEIDNLGRNIQGISVDTEVVSGGELFKIIVRAPGKDIAVFSINRRAGPCEVMAVATVTGDTLTIAYAANVGTDRGIKVKYGGFDVDEISANGEGIMLSKAALKGAGESQAVLFDLESEDTRSPFDIQLAGNPDAAYIITKDNHVKISEGPYTIADVDMKSRLVTVYDNAYEEEELKSDSSLENDELTAKIPVNSRAKVRIREPERTSDGVTPEAVVGRIYIKSSNLIAEINPTEHKVTLTNPNSGNHVTVILPSKEKFEIGMISLEEDGSASIKVSAKEGDFAKEIRVNPDEAGNKEGIEDELFNLMLDADKLAKDKPDGDEGVRRDPIDQIPTTMPEPETGALRGPLQAELDAVIKDMRNGKRSKEGALLRMFHLAEDMDLEEPEFDKLIETLAEKIETAYESMYNMQKSRSEVAAELESLVNYHYDERTNHRYDAESPQAMKAEESLNRRLSELVKSGVITEASVSEQTFDQALRPCSIFRLNGQIYIVGEEGTFVAGPAKHTEVIGDFEKRIRESGDFTDFFVYIGANRTIAPAAAEEAARTIETDIARVQRAAKSAVSSAPQSETENVTAAEAKGQELFTEHSKLGDKIIEIKWRIADDPDKAMGDTHDVQREIEALRRKAASLALPESVFIAADFEEILIKLENDCAEMNKAAVDHMLAKKPSSGRRSEFGFFPLAGIGGGLGETVRQATQDSAAEAAWSIGQIIGVAAAVALVVVAVILVARRAYRNRGAKQEEVKPEEKPAESTAVTEKYEVMEVYDEEEAIRIEIHPNYTEKAVFQDLKAEKKRLERQIDSLLREITAGTVKEVNIRLGACLMQLAARDRELASIEEKMRRRKAAAKKGGLAIEKPVPADTERKVMKAVESAVESIRDTESYVRALQMIGSRLDGDDLRKYAAMAREEWEKVEEQSRIEHKKQGLLAKVWKAVSNRISIIILATGLTLGGMTQEAPASLVSLPQAPAAMEQASPAIGIDSTLREVYRGAVRGELRDGHTVDVEINGSVYTVTEETAGTRGLKTALIEMLVAEEMYEEAAQVRNAVLEFGGVLPYEVAVTRIEGKVGPRISTKSKIVIKNGRVQNLSLNRRIKKSDHTNVIEQRHTHFEGITEGEDVRQQYYGDMLAMIEEGTFYGLPVGELDGMKPMHVDIIDRDGKVAKTRRILVQNGEFAVQELNANGEFIDKFERIAVAQIAGKIVRSADRTLAMLEYGDGGEIFVAWLTYAGDVLEINVEIASSMPSAAPGNDGLKVPVIEPLLVPAPLPAMPLMSALAPDTEIGDEVNLKLLALEIKENKGVLSNTSMENVIRQIASASDGRCVLAFDENAVDDSVRKLAQSDFVEIVIIGTRVKVKGAINVPKEGEDLIARIESAIKETRGTKVAKLAILRRGSESELVESVVDDIKAGLKRNKLAGYVALSDRTGDNAKINMANLVLGIIGKRTSFLAVNYEEGEPFASVRSQLEGMGVYFRIIRSLSKNLAEIFRTILSTIISM